MKKQPLLYQQLLSAFFGLLYLFIVTPVQYWHQHPAKTIGATEQAQQYQYRVSSSDNTDCSVCSHKYSGYDPIIVTPLLADLPFINLAYSSLSVSRINYIQRVPWNKGPPFYY